jgi:hypothetical protein
MSRRSLVLSVALGMIGGTGCGGDATGTQEGVSQVSNLAGPSGLGQDLRLSFDPESFRIPGRHTLVVRSTVTNGSTQPVRLRSRVCRFFDDDFESTATLDRVDALATCGAVEQILELAPGASVGPLEQRFVILSGPGSYQLTVRHALDPAFETTASFNVP